MPDGGAAATGPTARQGQSVLTTQSNHDDEVNGQIDPQYARVFHGFAVASTPSWLLLLGSAAERGEISPPQYAPAVVLFRCSTFR